jgi:hypothetical protein
MVVGAIRLQYIPTQWKVDIVSVMAIANFRDSIEKKNCKSERTIEGAEVKIYPGLRRSPVRVIEPFGSDVFQRLW